MMSCADRVRAVATTRTGEPEADRADDPVARDERHRHVRADADAVQERRDAADDPLGVWAKADAQYAERAGK